MEKRQPIKTADRENRLLPTAGISTQAAPPAAKALPESIYILFRKYFVSSLFDLSFFLWYEAWLKAYDESVQADLIGLRGNSNVLELQQKGHLLGLGPYIQKSGLDVKNYGKSSR